MTVQQLRQLQQGDKIYFVRTPQDAAMYKRRLELDSNHEKQFEKYFTEYSLKTFVRSGIYEEYVAYDILHIQEKKSFSTTLQMFGKTTLNHHSCFEFPNIFRTYLEAAAYYDEQCDLWKKEKENEI